MQKGALASPAFAIFLISGFLVSCTLRLTILQLTCMLAS